MYREITCKNHEKDQVFVMIFAPKELFFAIAKKEALKPHGELQRLPLRISMLHLLWQSIP